MIFPLQRPVSGRRSTARRWPAAIGIAAALALIAWSGTGRAQAPLPALGADLGASSVSGLSAGAFMASQFHIAHSRIVVGVGIVAGGPYACAEDAFLRAPLLGKVAAAIQGCMVNSLWMLGVPNIAALEGRVSYLWRVGRIDPVAELSRARVYLYSGTADQKVMPAIVKAAGDLYAQVGVPLPNIKRETGPAGHAFVTETQGIDCGQTGRPYVTHCKYDQAGDILKHIYPDMDSGSRSATPAIDFLLFDQRPFVRGLASSNGLDVAGFAYIPKSCSDTGRCRAHVVFHGCDQQRSQIGDQFVKESGFAEWADNNRLVILFPQVKETAGVVNPLGCWDWWGYTGSNYLTRNAPQIVAVRRMLDRLAQPRGSN
jgi:poly(3-hydroxybutyrate) depolymerase